MNWLAVIFFFSAIFSVSAVEFLIPYYHLTEAPPTLDSDHSQMAFGVLQGRLQAKVGQDFALIAKKKKDNLISFNLTPFIELHNFSTDQSVPWQMWRGFIGGYVLFDSAWFQQILGLRALNQLGFFHESDHISDGTDFKTEFLESDQVLRFDNRSLRSFEFIKAKTTLVWQSPRVTLAVSLGFKYFTPPVNPYAPRLLQDAILAELKIGRRVFDWGTLWLSGYYQRINADLHSIQFLFVRNLPGFLTQNSMQLSWHMLNANKTSFEVYVGYEESFGQGMDFSSKYKGFVAGLRLQF